VNEQIKINWQPTSELGANRRRGACGTAHGFRGDWRLVPGRDVGCQYCTWLQLLCAAPQHAGLSPDVSDFRLCCRTYTCGCLPALLYWSMLLNQRKTVTKSTTGRISFEKGTCNTPN